MQARTLNKKLSQLFRLRGLTLRPDAAQPLYDALQGDEGWEITLQALLNELLHQELNVIGHVDGAAVRRAVATLHGRASQRPKLEIEVIDAFGMPAPYIDKQRRMFTPETAPQSLHASAASKSAMCGLRLAMVEGRVRRHEMFKQSVLGDGVAPRQHLAITSIDALLGKSGMHVVLGLLTETEEGTFILEDAHASVPVDLSRAEVAPGLFTHGAVVLAEGAVCASGVFVASQLGLPPPEAIARSTESLGGFDPSRKPASALPTKALSGISSASATSRASLPTHPVALQKAMLVVIAELHLDVSATLCNLQTLFTGYEQVGSTRLNYGRNAVPLASFFTFALCGNFGSSSLAASVSQSDALLQGFRELARILTTCAPTLAKHAHFIIVPGPDDPTTAATEVLPRAPLPAYVCDSLLTAVSNCTLATSPTRLVLCEQTIVLHREDLLLKARRACLLPPQAAAANGVECDINFHLVKSIVDQAHLCPLPPAESAVYWQYEHTMWLHPAPDVLVVADRQAQFQLLYEETLTFNPGAFASELSWMVYRPMSREVEASSLEKL